MATARMRKPKTPVHATLGLKLLDETAVREAGLAKDVLPLLMVRPSPVKRLKGARRRPLYRLRIPRIDGRVPPFQFNAAGPEIAGSLCPGCGNLGDRSRVGESIAWNPRVRPHPQANWDWSSLIVSAATATSMRRAKIGFVELPAPVSGRGRTAKGSDAQEWRHVLPAVDGAFHAGGSAWWRNAMLCGCCGRVEFRSFEPNRELIIAPEDERSVIGCPRVFGKELFCTDAGVRRFRAAKVGGIEFEPIGEAIILRSLGPDGKPLP